MTDQENPQVEEVKNDNVNPNTSEQKEGTDTKDYKELYSNMQKALKEEREARKERDLKLQEFEAKEKAEIEKKLKEKGKFEELLTEKEKLIADLMPKAESRDKHLTAKQEALKQELETVEKEYPKDMKEKFSDILEKLDDEGKLNFYKKTMENKKEADKQ